MRIIGIDPGYGRVGVGIIESNSDTWKALYCTCIETNAKLDFVARLGEIDQKLQKIIEVYKPNKAAVETLFFSSNTKTAIKVAEARGAMLHLLYKQGIPIVEFGPLQVKQAVVGYGKAQKDQVQHMVAMRLGLKSKRFQDDAADALAIALTAGLMG